jgi:hypothetical protein
MKKLLTTSLVCLSTVTAPYIASDLGHAQPLLPPQETPTTTITLKGDQITVRIVNRTEGVIVFQALGDTRRRPLEAGSVTKLQNLSVPLSIAFYYRDVKRNYSLTEGLIDAKIVENKSTGIIDLVLSPTLEPDNHKSSMYLYTDGSINLY